MCKRGVGGAGGASQKMGNAMRPEARLQAAERCGAHCRTTGKPCRGPAMTNGRCRMHGGKAGRKPTHGRYTKTAIADLLTVRAILRRMRDLMEGSR